MSTRGKNYFNIIIFITILLTGAIAYLALVSPLPPLEHDPEIILGQPEIQPTPKFKQRATVEQLQEISKELKERCPRLAPWVKTFYKNDGVITVDEYKSFMAQCPKYEMKA